MASGAAVCAAVFGRGARRSLLPVELCAPLLAARAVGKLHKNWTVGVTVIVAVFVRRMECITHRSQLIMLVFNIGDIAFGKQLTFYTGRVLIARQIKKASDVFEAETRVVCELDEFQCRTVGLIVVSVIIVGLCRAGNQSDLFAAAGRFRYDTALGGSLTYLHGFDSYSAFFRRRKALAMTDTELKLIAAAANMGLISIPRNGNKTPAAIGTPRVL